MSYKSLSRQRTRDFCDSIAASTFYLSGVEVNVVDDPHGGLLLASARFQINHARKEVEPSRNVAWAREHIEARLPRWSSMNGRLVMIEEETVAGVTLWLLVGFQVPTSWGEA